MTRTALCFGLALMIAAPAPAAAEPLGGPRIDHFTQADLDWARVVSEATPLPTGHEWEGSNVAFDEKIAANEALGRSSTNNDTAHYARGSTLVVHVFISHLGGTWDATERNAAGATAYVAKNYFVTNAPANANLTFDHQESTGYVNWQVTLPVNILDGQTGDYIQDAIMALGFTDSDGDGNVYDDFPLWHQSWDGGWDNVICVYQAADITGGAWASYSTATVVVYETNNANVWAHEFGHSFGACDEYVNAGQCNFGIDCGPCQSSYLHQVFNNDNCQLASCPMDVGCLMDSATFDAICPTTLEHWAWVDDDSNNLLDEVKRHISGTTFVWIRELYNWGYYAWNYVGDGFVCNQRSSDWAVAGVRSEGTADYDIHLFQDNNHNLEVASSTYGGTSVDFVVTDYNHTRSGNEHLELVRYSGPADNYHVQHESGHMVAYPDGVHRNMPAWTPGDVAWVVEVPLFAGETVSFSLSIDSPNLDLGMALFRSNGDTYYAGRVSAEWQADTWGPGALESAYYTVPADDVYGLVIWSNSAQAGAFGLQIGPTPIALSEETPIASEEPLDLYTYVPNAPYWSVVGSRGYGGTGTDLSLFSDVNYLNELETSNTQGANGVELIAVDYNSVSTPMAHLRSPRNIGSGFRTVEWEHDDDISWGFTGSSTWVIGHTAKVWDVLLSDEDSYYFRQYHGGTTLDTGLFLFDSSGGDPYQSRAEAAAAGDWQSASSGGEWFTYAPSLDSWAGLVMIANNQASDAYSIWHGPLLDLQDEDRVRRGDEVVFATSTPSTNYWRVYAARAIAGLPPDVWLYGDEAYTASSIRASDQDGVGAVSYVVADYNPGVPGTEYPRFLNSGLGVFDMEVEGEAEPVGYYRDFPVEQIDTWPVDDVAEAWDIWIDSDTGGHAHIEVEDLSGSMDLGIALFASNGSVYYANESSAVAAADAAGFGGKEAFDVFVPGDDWYGLVIYNKTDGTGGDYVLRVSDPAAVSVEPGLDVTEFAFAASPNPFASSAQLSFALPAPDRVDLAIYDVQGRLIRRLADGPYPAGAHALSWDGRDDGGSAVAAGVYLARIQTTGTREVRKLIRLQ